ncbi:hypothetical protein HIM_08654 [Hirsutella minnesotensis 3608]|uniref:DNA (cytosine-5-)-methyltransferase n=1 Tax=Hirsutella minnesotensis 3608 TaxID=1043627 RepID=A0A0F8A3K2_9HYPO|nr:hypothetical protein HIM_08654 [Hirsutella minnesotensis 3608]
METPTELDAPAAEAPVLEHQPDWLLPDELLMDWSDFDLAQMFDAQGGVSAGEVFATDEQETAPWIAQEQDVLIQDSLVQDSLIQDSVEPPDATEEESHCIVQVSSDADETRASPTLSPPMSQSLRVELPEFAMLAPRSCYEPFDPGVPTMPEAEALASLSAARRRLQVGSDDDYIQYDLDDFAVYCDTARYPCEMRPLHHLDTKAQLGDFLFDGILSVGGENRIFVRRVPIVAMPVDNYGDLSKHTVQGDIWLQSKLNRRRSIYYRLGSPAKEYARFFHPSVWVADLAKHFVDFLKVMRDRKRSVTIHMFRTTFRGWLRRKHKDAPAFVGWLKQHPRHDFRCAVAANVMYLHKEAIGVLGERETLYHTIWAEILFFSRYRRQPQAASPRTVVTQYTHDCFKHMPFGDQLEVVPMSPATGRLRDRLIRERHLELPSALHGSAKAVSTAAKDRIRSIQPGDTISTHRDGEQSGTMWKREVSRGCDDADRWFALVQRAHGKKNGSRVFDVIWYYRPGDTLCGLMKYPWNNELFLSDHCSCTETQKISEHEVLGVHDVDFGGTSTTPAEFFCRQTYVHQERKWITLDRQHMSCPHAGRRSRSPRYLPGDTLLVLINAGSHISEPCELDCVYKKDGEKAYRFRRLFRRAKVDPQARGARPNELVFSHTLAECKEQSITGRCHVRFFTTDSEIPAPYDRNGVGCCFFITHEQSVDQDGNARFAPLEAIPETLRQGYDPDLVIPRLRGIDLFCGGGNFGRGLEDGGAIEMNWANDYDSKAIHTYMANVADPGTVSAFLGSIDDLQRQAILGKFSQSVPLIGDVDFISAGSPCPGFSRLTNDKTTVQQRKNQSLVAAFASFVDLYRPRYGLLENVPGIVHRTANRDQDVFSQLICAIVGLGYQTQFFFLDASSCGSAQRRSRVFLAFAAPGHELPAKPIMTHSHPPNTKGWGLGLLPTGEPMAVREMPSSTPFDFISAEEATSDLPPILDAKPDICVPFPDHRVSLGITRSQRLRTWNIPKQPWGSNFAQAWFGTGRIKAPGAGVMTAAEHALFIAERREPRSSPSPGESKKKPATCCNRVLVESASSNAYGRLYPNRLLETIVTTPNPADAKNGRSLHWHENRVITIMEARRAQGVRDDEVLLGSAPTQYKIVGNSVAREAAVSLGLVFREAWVETLHKNKELEKLPITGEDTRVESLNAQWLGNDLGAVDDTSVASEQQAGLWSGRDTSTPASTAASRSSAPGLARTSTPTKRQSFLTVEIRSKKRCRGESRRESIAALGSGIMDPSPLSNSVTAEDDLAFSEST